ncbi:hypothetical protein AB4Y40_40280 [Paraburkholderia sp. EG287B]|uniref:hypothetical protein n=1 Tax=Paraburkholderia sp. EG287B TaxID=3237010 RepID=UPI0034D30BD8
MEKPDYAAISQHLSLAPQEVVKANERIRKWACLHPTFAKLLRTILDGISGRSRDSLIVVNASARAGKTTLSETIARIVDELAQRQGKSRGCLRFSVPSPDKLGRFDWRAAITLANASSGQVFPAERGAALWQSFVDNLKSERLVTIVDEGDMIPATQAGIQVKRAIDRLKYIAAQTQQPILIFGARSVRHIAENDTQLKVRTRVIMLDAYGDLEETRDGFITILNTLGCTKK